MDVRHDSVRGKPRRSEAVAKAGENVKCTSWLADFASKYLAAELGEAGRSTRATIGVYALYTTSLPPLLKTAGMSAATRVTVLE